jgi:ABC-type glycerol-3-phosphate transport system substrate-binding protein
MTDLKRSINRRLFLGAAAAAAGAAALAACGNPNPQAPAVAGKPTEAPKPAAAATTAPSASTSAPAAGATKPAAGATTAPAAAAGSTPAAAAKAGAPPKEIFTMVDKTWSDLGMKAATELFNKEHAALGQVTLEETAQGWDTKVLQQIRDNNLRWSGHGYAAFFDSHKYIKAGLVAPIDDYLKSSKIAWGQKQQDAYFTKRIYDALLLDGKQYYIPMKANVHLVGYRQDIVQQAGYEVFPKTWDETDKMIAKLKPTLEKQDMVAMGISRDMFRTLGTAFTTFIEKPFDDDGVLKFESPEWIQWMELVKKWKDMGMVRVDGPEHSDAWQKGKFVFSLGSHSQVRLGRGVHGPKVNGAPPPQPNTTQPPRTWIHIDSGFVFPNAPNPQLATDWLLSILGPDGAPAEAWWKTVVTFSGQPVHQGMVDKALKDNQNLKEVWDIMQLVPNSQIITLPVAGAYAIVQAKMWAHLDQYLDGKVGIKEAMASVRKEVNEELAKIKK